MAKEYFAFTGKIPFEGKESKNVMAFHYYEPERVVMGKKMKDWLKFAMAWWHTLGGASGDQFGGQTRCYEWDQATDAVQRAKDKMDAGFEIMDKLGIEYYCWLRKRKTRMWRRTKKRKARVRSYWSDLS